MNDLITSFQLNVSFIVQESIGYSREFLFEYPVVYLQDDLVIHRLGGNIEVSRTSEGLLAQGKFQANHLTTCSRCLENFEQVLSTEFAELFCFTKSKDTESELILPENGEIDFGPIIRDYFMLEMDISPICKTSCKGLCPICGEKIVGESCVHNNEVLDSRFSILKSLLDEE